MKSSVMLGLVVAVVAGLASSGAAGALSPGVANAAEWKTRVVPMWWRIDPSSVTRRKSVRVVASTGYCVGFPLPSVDHVTVVERRRRAVITVFVREPAVETLLPCAEVGLEMRARVKLKRPADRLAFYDGSMQPPQRRWPLKRP